MENNVVKKPRSEWSDALREFTMVFTNVDACIPIEDVASSIDIEFEGKK